MEIAIKNTISSLFLILVSSLSHASSPATEIIHFPTNHGAEIVKDPSRYDGELVAMEVRIVEITDKGRNGQTYMKAEFPDGAPTWLAAIGKVSDSFKVGDIVHVLGYLSAVHDDDKVTLSRRHPVLSSTSL